MKQNNSRLVKNLKAELGRYMMKVDNDARLIAELRHEIECWKETMLAQDAITSALVRLQSVCKGDNEEGKVFVPYDEVKQGIDKYGVLAYKDDERQAYVLQVVELHKVEESGDA